MNVMRMPLLCKRTGDLVFELLRALNNRRRATQTAIMATDYARAALMASLITTKWEEEDEEETAPDGRRTLVSLGFFSFFLPVSPEKK